MAGKTINTTVNHAVTLGVAGYGSPLTITSAGEILENPNNSAGVTSVAALIVPGNEASGIIINDGVIRGGEGIFQANGMGGDGVSMAAAATLTNALFIFGGYGGASGADQVANGGAGLVASAGGVIANTGAVSGGAGGDEGEHAPHGGAGMALTGATLTNSGTGFLAGIFGGAGGNAYYAGYGGAGLALTNGRATNSSAIVGGQGGNGLGQGGEGGDGVVLAQSGTLTNLAGGRISGGGSGATGRRSDYGGVGVYIPAQGKAASVSNAGTITGGAGAAGMYLSKIPTQIYSYYFYGRDLGGGGGTGVELKGTLSHFVNTGTVVGGAGGASMGANVNHLYEGGQGAVGLIVQAGATATNEGEILGGAGGYGYIFGGFGGGGVGVSGFISNGVIQYAAFYNQIGATVRAGAEGGTSSHGIAAGGALNDIGVFASDDAKVYNAGYIFGAANEVAVYVGNAYLQNSGYIFGGADGVGLDMNSGRAVNLGGGGIYDGADVAGTLMNYGDIIGAENVTGGVGVYLDNGSALYNAGVVAGGVVAGTSQTGDAVECGGPDCTVVAASGARFYGNVVGYTAGPGSVLEVTGLGGGILADVGTQFTGFNTVSFATNAARTVSGDMAGLASGQQIYGFGLGDGIVLTGFAEQGAFISGTVLGLLHGSSQYFVSFASGSSPTGAGVLLVGATGGSTVIDLSSTVTGATVGDYGLGLVMQGGVANQLVVADGGVVTVSSGGRVNGIEVGNGGDGYVQTGGFAGNVALNTGSYLAVSQGGTVSGATVHAGAELFAGPGAHVSNVTLADGELLDQGASLTGKVSFAGALGVLDIDQSAMPTTEIFGFAVGDRIILSEAAAASGKVKVSKAGVVTITAGGKTYKLIISGAKVGAKNYKFADDTLTETKKTAAAFLRPEVSAKTGAVEIPALSSAGAYPVMPLPAVQAGAGLWRFGRLTQEPWRPAQDAFAAMVTFQS